MSAPMPPPNYAMSDKEMIRNMGAALIDVRKQMRFLAEAVAEIQVALGNVGVLKRDGEP